MPDLDPTTDALTSQLTLVTGSSGNLGRELIERLHARGVPIRSLSRRPLEARPGVEPVVGDFTDPAVMREALHGVDTVFLIWPFLDTSRATPLIDELTRTGPRVVYLSSTAINDSLTEQSDPIVQVHADMEALLHSADLRPVILRSDTLASNVRGWAAQLLAGDVVTGPDMAPTAVVDERDVAEAAAAVLSATDDGTHDRNHNHNDNHEPNLHLLTGPHVLSRADLVTRLGVALGRDLSFQPVPADLAGSHMLADGRPAALVHALVAASTHRPVSRLVTDTVRQLCGHPARTFARWAADHGDEFR
ncbi:SDR family oxidoreductase [Streptomyces sp. NPDC048441]|uniref:SDR family oxidoreductase n=1 Tax=Streptomyces sp. NPDC048441 TaxID=3365552 RepID=UPI0037179B5C